MASLFLTSAPLVRCSLPPPQIISIIGLTRGGGVGYMVVKIVILVIASLGQPASHT